LEKRLIGRIGSAARNSTAMNASVAATAAVTRASMTGEPQGKAVPPSPVNKMTALSAAVSRIAPV
jgi:hypothetical protein